MSAILTEVTNSNDNLLIPTADINLKKRYMFSDLIEKPSKTSQNGADPIDYNSFLQFITTHNNCYKNKSKKQSKEKLYSCLVICQSALGIRFDNVKDLFKNNRHSVKIIEKSCKSCQSTNSKCKTIEANCLDTITFQSTKVKNPTKTFIIPQIYNCLENIKKIDSKILNYNDYNQFIKTNSNNQYTTHSCRKFLTNMSLKNRNTGGWSSYRTLEKNYTANHTKFAELASILDKKICH